MRNKEDKIVKKTCVRLSGHHGRRLDILLKFGISISENKTGIKPTHILCEGYLKEGKCNYHEEFSNHNKDAGYDCLFKEGFQPLQ